MAAISTANSGFWDAAATWVGGVPPAGANTFNILNTHTVTVRTSGGAVGCAGGIIAVGGKLSVQSTANLTMTGPVTHNGTFEMLDSGSNATPTLMTLTGCVWTCGAAAIWNILGTLLYTAPGIKTVGNNTSYIDFALNSGISGIITKCEFLTFGHANGVLYRNYSYPGTALTISDIFFNSIAGNIVVSGGSINLSGNILLNNTSATYSFSETVFGSATITIQNSTATTKAAVSGGAFYGTTILNINEKAGASRILNIPRFRDFSQLIIADIDSQTAINSVEILDDAALTITTTTGGRIMVAGNPVVATNGLVQIFGASGIYIQNAGSLNVKRLRVTVTGGAIYLAYILTKQNYWQASRSIDFGLIGFGSIVPRTTSVSQYEPILYIYNYATYLFGIQYDFDSECPNYVALYGDSTNWTPATKTLAAGGVLIIKTTGHTATGMDMAIKDLSAFALASSGTAAWTALYNISFDGGVLWSGDLTLAQLQANSYTINGNIYTTDGRYNIQLKIKMTSALGGTVTQVRISGIKYDPLILQSWSVRSELTAIEGVGFVTASDSLYAIRILLTALGIIGAALSTFISGITSLKNWLRGFVRKDAMEAIAKAELNLGGGTYDETADSNEAISDKVALDSTVSKAEGTKGTNNIHDDVETISVAISTLPRTKLNKVYRMLEELKTLVEK